ncbi:MAG: hypothetical protein DIU70_005915 [Bacillota bacterium]|nr:MAG: hypothetical protein DIU70_15205 [Bacillota bacterium]
MEQRWRRAAALLSLLALVLAGCGSGSRAPARSLEVTVTVHPDRSAEVVATVTGLALGQDSHLHLSLNGGPEVMLMTEPLDRYWFRNLPPGEHEVRVWVTDQAHRPLNLEKTVRFTVP